MELIWDNEPAVMISGKKFMDSYFSYFIKSDQVIFLLIKPQGKKFNFPNVSLLYI